MNPSLRILAAATALLSACSHTYPPFGHPAGSEILEPSTAATDDLPAAPSYAGFRVLTSSCRSGNVGQGSPLVICRDRPIVGRPHQVAWTVNPTAPHEGNRPAWLLVWFDYAEPTRLDEWGYTGCVLWAPLDPSKLFTLTPSNGSILTQDGGRVRLNWTPTSEWLGRKVYCQLVVLSHGSNPRGWMLSPCLELQAGTR